MLLFQRSRGEKQRKGAMRSIAPAPRLPNCRLFRARSMQSPAMPRAEIKGKGAADAGGEDSTRAVENPLSRLAPTSTSTSPSPSSPPPQIVSAEAIDRALGYPYPRPPSSFVWSWKQGEDGDDDSGPPHGFVHSFDDRAWASPSSREEEEEGEEGERARPPLLSAEALSEKLGLPSHSARALAAALRSAFGEEQGVGEGGGKNGNENEDEHSESKVAAGAATNDGKDGNEGSGSTGARLRAGHSSGEPWTAVLAIGSNAGPSQLARKFPRESFPEAAVPVLRAMLRGHDVCYAPLISSYGSVTATLHEAGGEGGEEGGDATSVEVWVTFLSPDLLERMHETEACYDLQRLDCPASGGGVTGGGGGGGEKRGKNLLLALGTCADSEALGRAPAAFLRSALCYTHQAGSLLLPSRHISRAIERHGGEDAGGRGGNEEEGEKTTTATTKTLVALSEVRALNRRLPSLPQRGAQAAVAAALAEEGHELLEEELAEVEAWVARNLTDEEARRKAVALLVERAARSFSSPSATRLEQLGSVFGRSVD